MSLCAPRAQHGVYSERAAARIVRDVVRTVAQVRLQQLSWSGSMGDETRRIS